MSRIDWIGLALTVANAGCFWINIDHALVSYGREPLACVLSLFAAVGNFYVTAICSDTVVRS